MHAYVAARVAGEAAIADAGLTATILRPWYVLGPGHWWPVVLVPFYAIGEILPPTRESARRLGLVSVAQMVRALVHAVESPPPPGRGASSRFRRSGARSWTDAARIDRRPVYAASRSPNRVGVD